MLGTSGPTLSRASVVRVEFDNACPEEEGFAGVSAKTFRVEGSTLGPERGPTRRRAPGQTMAEPGATA